MTLTSPRRGGRAGALAARAAAARLSGGYRFHGHRDLRLAPAGSVLRFVDRRLGEHHRPHPGGAGAGLLARRTAGRRPPERPPAGLRRARRRGPDRGAAVRRPALPRPLHRQPRTALGGRRGGLVRRLARALRPAGRAARHGDALRHPPGRHRRRRGRRRGRPRLCPVDRGQPDRHVRARPVRHPADRHPAHAARRGGDRRRWRRPRCSAGAGSSRPSRWRLLLAVPPGPGQGRGRRALRGRVALPVHRGRAAGQRRRRGALPLPERRLRGALGVAPRTPCSPAASGTCSSRCRLLLARPPRHVVCWATRPARRPAPTARSTPALPTTASRSTPRSRRGAALLWPRRRTAPHRPQRRRATLSCRRRQSATT